MSDANFASLSSTLLARKGGAKPAMRPQSAVLGPVDGVAAAANLEDLGWNDMGEDAPEQQSEHQDPHRPPQPAIDGVGGDRGGEAHQRIDLSGRYLHR